MAYQLQAINAAVLRDPVEFMAHCDSEFQAKVVCAADLICRNMARSPVVLLSGPSGSGKTTTAAMIRQELHFWTKGCLNNLSKQFQICYNYLTL